MPYSDKFLSELEKSRRTILQYIDTAQDIVFFHGWGNIGDKLIYWGIKDLLQDIPYRQLDMRRLGQESGHTAIISGSGGWSKHFNKLPRFLPEIFDRFQQVLILPSSYDINVPLIRETLTRYDAIYFARELISYNNIKNICRAELAYDCAFYYDYTPFIYPKGQGILNAFREDAASIWGSGQPVDNIDISKVCEHLPGWLKLISKHEMVRTDRLHVMIGSAMLGKIVEYTPAYDHKVPGVAAFSLSDFPVYPVPDPFTTRFKRKSFYLIAQYDPSHVNGPGPKVKKVSITNTTDMTNNASRMTPSQKITRMKVLHKENLDLSLELQQINQRLQDRKKLTQQLQADLAYRHQILQEIPQSKSWKITRPLRKIMQFLRNIRK